MSISKPADPLDPKIFGAIMRDATLAGQVTQQIEELIVDGRLRPGDVLPPERELARQFGVSRTVVREAVSALVARSLLEVRTGSGTVVCSPTVRSVAHSMSLLLRTRQFAPDYDKLREVRQPLELAIARLAAERRTDEDVARMAAILAEAEQCREDRDRFSQLDVDFHAALAQATHNELFSVLLDSIADIMFKVRQLGYDVPGMPTRSLRHHRAVFEQVAAGDAEGAYQAMFEHMAEAEETLRQAVALARQREAIQTG